MISFFAGQLLISKGQKAARAAAVFQIRATKAMMRHRIELLGFLKHRSEQDVRLLDDLASRNEFNDAFEVFSGYFQTAMAEYAFEMGKLASLGSRTTGDMAKAVRMQTDAFVKDQAATTVA